MFTCRLTTYMCSLWSRIMNSSIVQPMLGVLTILVSFKKCLFNSIAHYSLTNKTHSHQRLKHWHEITRFEVTFQLGWSYLPAWHTPCELGESKSNCSSLRHVKRLDESKSFKSSWNSVSKLAIMLIWNIRSPHEDNLPSYIWKLQNHNIECAISISLSRARQGTIDLRQYCRFDIGSSCAVRLITNVVHTWVTHLHIAVPTITRSLRYA